MVIQVQHKGFVAVCMESREQKEDEEKEERCNLVYTVHGRIFEFD